MNNQKLVLWRKCSFVVFIGLIIIGVFLMHAIPAVIERWPHFLGTIGFVVITSTSLAFLFQFLWIALFFITKKRGIKINLKNGGLEIGFLIFLWGLFHLLSVLL